MTRGEHVPGAVTCATDIVDAQLVIHTEREIGGNDNLAKSAQCQRVVCTNSCNGWFLAGGPTAEER